jgi:hypothetical protein
LYPGRLLSILTQALRCLACTGAMLLLLEPARAEGGPIEFELFGTRDSNPNSAQPDNAVGAENVQAARLTWLRSALLDQRSGMMFSGGGTIERHSAYSGLNNLVLNAGIRYRIQPNVGYTMPRYELALELERHSYADSAIRNATSAALELSVAKHFTDRIYSSAGVGISRSLADREQVFDLNQRKLFATLAYRFGLDNTLRLSLSRHIGDQVFGAHESDGLNGTARASGDDPVFGAGYYAYRLGATSTIAGADLNFPLRGNGELSIGVRRNRTYADGGQAYASTRALLGWRYRYY